MTPEQIELVRRTALVVEDDSGRFGHVFYERLFQLDPQARSLFHVDMVDQQQKLVDEVAFLAAAVDDFPGFVQRAHALGERHRGYGVRPVHYGVVQVALIDALSATLGEEWTDDAATAWRRLYALVAETMLEGAAPQLFERVD